MGDLDSDEDWIDLCRRSLEKWRREVSYHKSEAIEVEGHITAMVKAMEENWPPQEIPINSRVVHRDGKPYTVLYKEFMRYWGTRYQCGAPAEIYNQCDAGWKWAYDLTGIDEEEFLRLKESILMEQSVPKSD